LLLNAMKTADILRLRLECQGLARARFRKPEDVVGWFGAVQAQDYLGSLWALGLRMRRATESMVEAAEARRAIVRTWPMRGTLHFVAAGDARWLTRLLAPRVIARHSARWKREIGVDARMIARADEVLVGALEGGKRLTREQVYEALESRRIRTGGSRGLHILLCLAMQGRVCLAGRVGKQQTFALLDEWIPTSRELVSEEALAELAQRYFSSHGPATLKDFTWWSGLTSKEAQAAVSDAGSSLATATADGARYWWRDSGKRHAARSSSPQVRLLPAYDEYTVAYQDRSSIADGKSRASKMGLLSPAVLVDGRVVGSWKRVIERNGVRVITALSRKLTADEKAALQAAVGSYGDFLGMEARLAR
jgi:hypothetical protein